MPQSRVAQILNYEERAARIYEEAQREAETLLTTTRTALRAQRDERLEAARAEAARLLEERREAVATERARLLEQAEQEAEGFEARAEERLEAAVQAVLAATLGGPA